MKSNVYTVIRLHKQGNSNFLATVCDNAYCFLGGAPTEYNGEVQLTISWA